MNDIELAKALGLFSLGLGAAEVAVPRRLIRLLGLPRSVALVRLFGAREIGAGAAALLHPDSPGPIWARVGGDVLDLGFLVWALRPSNPRRTAATVATAAVLAITALDVLCATGLTGRQARVSRTAQRTRLALTAGR